MENLPRDNDALSLLTTEIQVSHVGSIAIAKICYSTVLL